MKDKIRNLPLQSKMMGVALMVNFFVLLINFILLAGINNISKQIDTVYQANIQLNELNSALNNVQDSMKEYLNTKTSDSLENYYRNISVFSELADSLPSEITEKPLSRMERSIKNMAEKYLNETEQTIEAKRGRNVEKYRVYYENATRKYGYLSNYIYSINNEQFKENSESYREMINTFKLFETMGNIIMIAVVFINALLIAKLTGAIISPLKELTIKANEVAKGNFDIELLPAYSKDEIGVVTVAFNKMVLSIQEYIKKMVENAELEQKHIEKELTMEAHLKDAQLKYLQAQINPHFLFNTLNAGAQLAMMEGADRTNEYVRVMADFFRYNVKKGANTVTIGEELELVDNYIYILNVRFSGDIHYEKEIDESLLNVNMPSMILQPIVENCVNHGIHEMLGEGIIRMKVFRLDNTACISISDNGAGMDKQTIDCLMNGKPVSQKKEHSNGVGMDNVIARLRLFEGSDDVMSIESEGQGMGSNFTIYLEIKGEQDV